MQLKKWWFVIILPLWKGRIQKVNYANFINLEKLRPQPTDDNMDVAMSTALKQDICVHLETLETALDGYFKCEGMKFDSWIWNSFTVDFISIDDSDLAKDDLTNMRTKQMMRECLILKVLENFDVHLLKCFHCWRTEPWQYLFHSRWLTSVNMDFQHCSIFRHPVETDLMPIMICMWHYPKCKHSFQYLLCDVFRPSSNQYSS